jgi:hypothetical protein
MRDHNCSYEINQRPRTGAKLRMQVPVVFTVQNNDGDGCPKPGQARAGPVSEIVITIQGN